MAPVLFFGAVALQAQAATAVPAACFKSSPETSSGSGLSAASGSLSAQPRF